MTYLISGNSAPVPAIRQWGAFLTVDRKTIVFIALAYRLIILILGLLFFLRRRWLVFVPAAFGPVAVGVPWFGALGAVLISLTGVFEHEHDWDPGYWPWHVSRPLIGIGLGVVRRPFNLRLPDRRTRVCFYNNAEILMETNINIITTWAKNSAVTLRATLRCGAPLLDCVQAQYSKFGRKQ
jgi:hypothetical protein